MSIYNDYTKYNLNNYLSGGVCNCCQNSNRQTSQSVFGGFQTQYSLPAMNGFLNQFMNFGFMPTFEFNPFYNMSFSFPNISNFTLPNFAGFSLPTLPTLPTFNLPTFNFPKINFTSIVKSDTENGNKPKLTGTLAEQLKAKGVKYNSTLGKGLASSVLKNATGGTGQCAQYVNDALEANGINAQRDGHAYTRANLLAQNSKFTEISVSSQKDMEELPIGTVIVYGRGAANYSSEHGHVAIIDTNGNATSDHTQSSIKYVTGADIRVFVPTQKETIA